MTDRPAQSAPRCLAPTMCGKRWLRGDVLSSGDDGSDPWRCPNCHPAPSAPPERPGEAPPLRTMVAGGVATTETRDDRIEEEIEHVINRHSRENASNTPDWILAAFLMECLRAFERATRRREEWHGRPAPPADVATERPGEAACDCREIEARDGVDPTGRICSCECHWRGHRNRQCPGCLGTIERGDCSRHGEAPNGCCKPGRILPAPPADVAGPPSEPRRYTLAEVLTALDLSNQIEWRIDSDALGRALGEPAYVNDVAGPNDKGGCK